MLLASSSGLGIERGSEHFPVLAFGGGMCRQWRQHDPVAPREIVACRGSVKKLFSIKRSELCCSVAADGCVCSPQRLYEYSTGHLIINKNPGSAWISYCCFHGPLIFG